MPATAAPDGDAVVINEIYTRGGSVGQPFAHKFVELYNPTSSPVRLDGWSLQYRSYKNSGTNKANLSGTIPPKGYFLIQGGQNSPGGGPYGEALPTPDIANVSINPAGDRGIVFLVRGTTNLSLPDGDLAGSANVVDLVGYGSAAVFEGEGAPSPSFTESIERTGGVDTDNNAADFTRSKVPTPTNSGHALPPSEASPGPADGGGSNPADGGETAPAPGGGGGSTTPGCRHVPSEPATIAQIQGTGEVTPFLGCRVTTSGVVTAAYPVGGFDGVVIQTPGTGGVLDLATHTASEAVFVRDLSLARGANIGDHVRVRGYADEYYGLTQITRASWEMLSPAEPVTPVHAPWPASDEERERLESMLLQPQGSYVVTDLYESATYGTIGLASGDEPLRQPTDVARPGTPEAAHVAADNSARKVTLDDGSTWRYPNFAQPYHETPLPFLRHDEPVRIGAPVTFHAPVIVDWRNGEWKFQPTSRVTGDTSSELVTFGNTRLGPPQVGGTLVVGTFNMENYFLDLGEHEAGCEPVMDRHGAPSGTKNCRVRGAFDAGGLERQSSKLTAGIIASGAHVLALQEVQNTRSFPTGTRPPQGVHQRDVALAHLVDELNAETSPGAWAYVPSPEEFPRGEDVIRNAFIYQPAHAQPVGPSTILHDSAFRYGREPLAQAFVPAAGSGNQTPEEVLASDPDAAVLLVTTHLKSKRSGTGEDADQGDGQGPSNATRLRQARALADFVDDLIGAAASRVGVGAGTSARSGPHATPNVLLLGDFNSYTREDPMEELYARGYVNLTSGTDLPSEPSASKAGLGGRVDGSYVFDGELGSLDHILANPAALSLVTGAGVWSINAHEAPALGYSKANHNVTDLYAPSPYRSSDHDPLFVGLRLDAAPVALAPEVEPEAEPEPDGESLLENIAGWIIYYGLQAFLAAVALGIVIALVALVVISRRRRSRRRGSRAGPGSR